MKKKIFFTIFSALLLICKLINVNIRIDEKINIFKYLNYISSNLYNIDEEVSALDIEVFDYNIKEDILIIEPINQEVRLPINGMITEIGKNYVLIQNKNSSYYISNLNEIKFNLYQYYRYNMILGYSNHVYVKADEYKDILSGIIINYEKV